MDNISPFHKRMDISSKNKKSKIVLALDPFPRANLTEFVKNLIRHLEKYICAIKINFHLLLPLSISQISEINVLVHSYGLQSIADIKLNDIIRTNEIAIRYLSKMGFDAVIVNPFIGKEALKSAVRLAHQNSCGIIALVYMSHREAKEGFGINVVNKENRTTAMYKLFLEYAYACDVDGIIVGATQVDVLKEISFEKRVPIYSPGIGIQGGNLEQAAKNGTDYFIIGSSIIGSDDPLMVVKQLQQVISHLNIC